MYNFIENIYKPLIKIEKAMNKIDKEELTLDFDINESENMYTYANNLDKVVTALKKIINKEYKNEILKKQAEYLALQSQINPHFLYNTLESIRGEALIEDMDSIAEMTEALSTFFRYSINQKGNLVTLKQELKNIKNYFTIQQYRFNNKFNLKIIYDKDDDQLMDYMLPKMTLQPIIENAVSHGLETKMGEGTITIRIIATTKRLIINIADDGVGIDKTTLSSLEKQLNNNLDNIVTKDYKHTGIALINVNQRIKLLFGENYGLSITSTPLIGTDVEVTIPLTVEEEGKTISEVNNFNERRNS